MTHPNKATFDSRKAEMQEYAVKSVQPVIDEYRKAKAILEALQNEKEEYIARQKEKLASTGEMTADEYVELRNKETGLNARIEYYTALLVDLDEKLYQSQEKLHDLQRDLKFIRSGILFDKANELLQEIIEREKEHLSDLFTLLHLSDKMEPHPASNETEKDKILSFIKSSIIQQINTDKPLDTEYSVHSEQLKGFVWKSPARKHREKFEPKKTGLEQLLNNL